MSWGLRSQCFLLLGFLMGLKHFADLLRAIHNAHLHTAINARLTLINQSSIFCTCSPTKDHKLHHIAIYTTVWATISFCTHKIYTFVRLLFLQRPKTWPYCWITNVLCMEFVSFYLNFVCTQIIKTRNNIIVILQQLNVDFSCKHHICQAGFEYCVFACDYQLRNLLKSYTLFCSLLSCFSSSSICVFTSHSIHKLNTMLKLFQHISTTSSFSQKFNWLNRIAIADNTKDGFYETVWEKNPPPTETEYHNTFGMYIKYQNMTQESDDNLSWAVELFQWTWFWTCDQHSIPTKHSGFIEFSAFWSAMSTPSSG